jgi:dipeptidyl aminopeptidase
VEDAGEGRKGGFAPVPASHVVTLSWEGQRLAKDSIIQEVAWVHNATLIIKEINRSGDDGSVILFDLSHRLDRMGIIVRTLGKNGEQSDSGWIDAVRRDLGITMVK